MKYAIGQDVLVTFSRRERATIIGVDRGSAEISQEAGLTRPYLVRFHRLYDLTKGGPKTIRVWEDALEPVSGLLLLAEQA